LFLEKLEKPSLQILHIKFSFEATGPMYLDMLSCAQENLRLDNLTELGLTSGGWFPHCDECATRPDTEISPVELRKGLSLLLPLPHLKTLHLSAAPNFLDILDLDL
jgi:hypothetical protein